MKHSGFAITSFIIAAVGATVFFGAVAIAIKMSMAGGSGGGVFTIGALVGAIAAVMGLVLGLIGLFARGAKKIFAVIGVLLALTTGGGLAYVIRACYAEGVSGMLRTLGAGGSQPGSPTSSGADRVR